MHGGAIAAVGQYAVQDEFGEVGAQFLGDAIQVVFALVDNDERLRPQPRQLPAQFGTDRTAPAGNQHAACGQRLADRGPVQLHRVATQQILDRHVLDFVELRATGHDVIQTWHGAIRQIGGVAQGNHAAHLVGRGTGHGDQQHVHRRFPRHVGQLFQITQHGVAIDAGTAQRHAVIHETHHGVAAVAAQVT